MEAAPCSVAKSKRTGGVLLFLDGDTKSRNAERFCAWTVVRGIAREAISIGAGKIFSVAVVLVRQEYETWFIASNEAIAGSRLPDGRLISKREIPYGDLEESPRNAKGWMNRVVQGGYKPTVDQASVTDLLNLEVLRCQNLRSFRRFESALEELVTAIRNESHVVTPE